MIAVFIVRIASKCWPAASERSRIKKKAVVTYAMRTKCLVKLKENKSPSHTCFLKKKERRCLKKNGDFSFLSSSSAWILPSRCKAISNADRALALKRKIKARTDVNVIKEAYLRVVNTLLLFFS